MSSKTADFGETIATAKNRTAIGDEKRRRRRVRITARVRVRGGIGTLETFDDIGSSIDVTRDGLLFITSRGGYWIGEALEVMFPYSDEPTALNFAQKAKVVRCTLTPDLRFNIAVEYQKANGHDLNWPWTSTPFPGKVRVLGVESDPRMAQTMRDLLEHDGYQVVFVPSTKQALDILRSEVPDVIFAEVECSEISGQDLCAIVKKSDRLRHVPVILLTSSALPSDYAACRDLGAVVCMMKPCKPARLQLAIHLVAPPPLHRSVYSAGFNMGAFVRTS
jgi:CheY-like chemotaxis protein